MITEKSYLEAQKIVDTYKSEQLNKHNVIKSVCVHEGCNKSSMCGNYCGKHCNCRKAEKQTVL